MCVAGWKGLLTHTSEEHSEKFWKKIKNTKTISSCQEGTDREEGGTANTRVSG